jgi:hypothetical protein
VVNSEQEGDVAVTIVGPALVEPGQTFDVSTLVYDQFKDAAEADSFLFRNHTGPQTLLDEDEEDEAGTGHGKKERAGKDLTLMLRIRQVAKEDAKDCQLKPSAAERVSNEQEDTTESGVAWGMDTGWGCTVKTSRYQGTPACVNFKLEVPQDTLHGDYEAQLVLMQEGPQGLTQIDTMDFSLRVGDLQLSKSLSEQKASEKASKKASETATCSTTTPTTTSEPAPAVPASRTMVAPAAYLKSLLEQGEHQLRYMTTVSQEIMSRIRPRPCADLDSVDLDTTASCMSSVYALQGLPRTLSALCSESGGGNCTCDDHDANRSSYETQARLVLCSQQLQMQLDPACSPPCSTGAFTNAEEKRIPLHALCVLSNATHAQRLAFQASVAFKVLADLTSQSSPREQPQRRGAALLVFEALAFHVRQLETKGTDHEGEQSKYKDQSGIVCCGEGAGLLAVDIEAALRAWVMVAALQACLFATAANAIVSAASSGLNASSTKVAIAGRVLEAVEAENQRGKACSSNCEGDGPEKSRNGRFWIPRFRSRWLGDFRGEAACDSFVRCQCATVQQAEQQMQQAAHKRVAPQTSYKGCCCGTDKWEDAKREEEGVYAQRKALSVKHGGVKYAIALQMEAACASPQGLGLGSEGGAARMESVVLCAYNGTYNSTCNKRKTGVISTTAATRALSDGKLAQQCKRQRSDESSGHGGHCIVPHTSRSMPMCCVSSAMSMREMLDQQRRALSGHCLPRTSTPTISPTIAPSHFCNQLQAMSVVHTIVPMSLPAPRNTVTPPAPITVTPPAPIIGTQPDPRPTIEPTVMATFMVGEDQSSSAPDDLDALSLDIYNADLDFDADFGCDLDDLLDAGLEIPLTEGCAW